ncbi:MAG: hypothetical protein KGN36_06435 [Acidobacteriota bacterium]|nr:hypothetical protein [Acidobacteriota bacterium]
MDLVKGEGQVFPKAGKSFDPALIPKAIQGAGFAAVGVVATAEGTLVAKQELVELQVPGLNHRFVLEGGSQSGTLKERTDLLGKRIRVTGTLHPCHGDLPPGLTVERFQPAQ